MARRLPEHPTREADLARLNPSQRKAHRQRRIVDLIGQGRALRGVYETIRAEYGVNDQTIRRDLGEVGKLSRARLEDAGILQVEIDRTVERIRERAKASPADVAPAVAQRADEFLLRFWQGSSDKRRLLQLGLDVQRHEAKLAELAERKAEAQVELAQAEAALARARSTRVDQPLIVVLRDLAGGVTYEEVAARSPTFADEEGSP